MKKNVFSVISKGILSLLTITSLFSCTDTNYFEKEVNDIEINVPIDGIPIGHSTYTTQELFEEIGTDLEVGSSDDNGRTLVSFTYNETIESINKDEFIDVSDQNVNQIVILPGLPKTTYIGPDVTFNEEVNSIAELKNNSDADLITLSFSQGEFSITLTNKLDSDIEVEFTINSLTKNEVPFVTTVNIPSKQTNTTTPEDLGGFVMKLNDGGEFNTVNSTLKTKVFTKTGDVFGETSEIEYQINLTNLLVETAEGDFKQESFDTSNKSFDLDFFEELGEGTIEFKNPTMKFNATNEFGFPLGLTLDNISATNGVTSNTLEIKNDEDTFIAENTDINNGFYALIDEATDKNTGVNSVIELNVNNSNIDELLNAKPNQFDLKVDGIVNPNSPTNNANFFNVNNNVNIDVEVELPLFVRFEDLKFETDPTEFDLEDIEENAKELSLRVAVKNTMPLAASIKLNFVNNTGTETSPNYTTIFSKSVALVDAAPIDDNGFSVYELKDENGEIVVKNGNLTIDPKVVWVDFTEEEISSLQNVTDLISEIEFDTVDRDATKAAKLQTTDQVRLELGLKGDLSISFEDEDEDKEQL